MFMTIGGYLDSVPCHTIIGITIDGKTFFKNRLQWEFLPEWWKRFDGCFERVEIDGEGRHVIILGEWKKYAMP